MSVIGPSNFMLDVARGVATGFSAVNKFGFAPDFDQADGEVYIWGGANDAGINAMTLNFSTTADVDQIISSDAADTVDVEVMGLDTNNALATQTATLNGANAVTLSTPLRRVFRMKNEGNVNLIGKVTAYRNGGSAATPADVRAIVDIGDEQTEMAIYTVPAGKKAIITSIYGAEGAASKDTEYILRLRVREANGVFQLKHRMAGSFDNERQHVWIPPKDGCLCANADIILTAEATNSGTTECSFAAGFDLVLEDV